MTSSESDGWPHVTAVIRAAGLMGDMTWYTDAARERGEAVHLACALLDEGDLDETSLVPEIRQQVDAYRRFLAETGYVPQAIEVSVASRTYRYRGRLDRLYTMPGSQKIALADLKPWARLPWHALQTAAYTRALMEQSPGFIVSQRLIVHLGPDGRYSIDMHRMGDLEGDFQVFLAALRVAHWKGGPSD